MGAELLARRTFGVEALEHRLQFSLRNAGPPVVDGDHDVARLSLRCKPDGAAGRREGHLLDDEFTEELAAAALDAWSREVRVIGPVPAEARRFGPTAGPQSEER